MRSTKSMFGAGKCAGVLGWSALCVAMGATACGAAEGGEDPEDTSLDEEVGTAEEPITQNATLVPLASRTSLEKSIVHVPGCTATLIRPDWVLTARHCSAAATGLPYASITVTHDNGASAVSNAVYLHPDPVVDAALIRLATPINAGQPASVPLFTGWDADVLNKTVTTYGYGGVSDLSRAQLTVAGIENNGSMQNWQRYNRKYLTIAGTVPGDSGGPSFLNGKIVAVTGGDPYKAYARTFRDWVNSYVSPATNNHMGAKVSFGSNLGPNGTILKTGDVDGNGYADIVQFNQLSGPAGSVYVILGSATGPGAMTRWHTAFSTTEVPAVGDVDGDGKDDIIKFDQSTGKVHIARSLGTSFNAALSQWHSSFSFSGETPRVADMNGDGRADVVTFVHYNNWGDVWVSLSCGSRADLLPQGCDGTGKFGTRIGWSSGFSLLNEVPQVGDVNGDGLADLVTFKQSSGTVSVGLTQKRACTTNADCGTEGFCWTGLGYCPGSFGRPAAAKASWGSGASFAGETPVVADMNGDGVADVANFETTTAYGRNGYFGVLLSNKTGFGGYQTWSTNLCKAGSKCITGDADRNGRVDAFEAILAGAASYAYSLAN